VAKANRLQILAEQSTAALQAPRRRLEPAILYRFLAVGVGLTAALISLLRMEWRRWCFINVSYYLLLVLGVTACAVLGRFLLQSWATLSRPYRRTAVISAAVLVAVVLCMVSREYRVLSDETNLVAVSKSLARSHTAIADIMGFWYYDNFWPQVSLIDKRPLLYPFLVSVLHSVSGYRSENAFFLNAIVLWALLSLSYLIFGARSWKFGVASQLLILSQPVVVLGAVSAGFDLLNCFLMIVTLLVTLYHFRLGSDESFRAWLVSLALLAQTRYESSLISVVIVGLAIGLRKVSYRQIRDNSMLILLLALLSLPLIWQSTVKWDAQMFEMAQGGKPFGWKYVVPHVRGMLRALFVPDPALPYNQWLDLAALGAIGLWLAARRTGPRLTREDWASGILCGGAVACQFGLVLAYYFGDAVHPASARFFMLPAVALAVAPLIFGRRATARLPRARRDATPVWGANAALTLGALACLIALPISEENRFYHTMTTPREARVIDRFLREHGRHDVLMVTDRPGQLTPDDYGAVDFGYARGHSGQLLENLQRHLFQNIYTAQWIDYDTRQPPGDQVLPVSWHLVPVLEIQTDAAHFMRISRVDNVR
jgi:hypothetical protein